MSVRSLDKVGAEGGSATYGSSKRRPKVLVALLSLLILVAATYWFVLRPGGEDAPEPGEVTVLEPIQINLTDGHYLRLSLGLQTTVKVTEEVDGSKALDAAVELFTGRSVQELSGQGARAALKNTLKEQVVELYEGEVMDLYFTEFVTQ